MPFNFILLHPPRMRLTYLSRAFTYVMQPISEIGCHEQNRRACQVEKYSRSASFPVSKQAWGFG
jgi:hypothetical protein